ncbi:J domain-containing protein [Pseudomonas sp. P66]|uniref:J domain-containing protein n=1 Tax=Pseudomonas arcuscaelestis TaxID=2710591 RepID=A0ABS2BY82_9PSED|nr:J domain-containing protein [Pseudomonas arcuscaelestis]MBM5458572.1 J domain-containing protein [Pseudomonas arcuscaelestis]
MRTHYHNLQVQEGADPAVIKASYKALAQRYHPDRNPDNPDESARIFRIITEAYEVLSDPAKRLKYDANLRAQREAAAAAAPKKIPRSASDAVKYPARPVSADDPTFMFRQFVQQLEQVINQVASNPRVPTAFRWLLSRPLRLILLLQLLLAAYLFRDVIL